MNDFGGKSTVPRVKMLVGYIEVPATVMATGSSTLGRGQREEPPSKLIAWPTSSLAEN
jgi:hypothetical protein